MTKQLRIELTEEEAQILNEAAKRERRSVRAQMIHMAVEKAREILALSQQPAQPETASA